MTVASSTYLTLFVQLEAILFTRIQNRRGASLVPCGVPPFSQAPRRGWGWGGFTPPPPPLFWLIKLLFQFLSKVLQKKSSSRYFMSNVRTSEETLLFPHCSISIPSIVFWRFSWCLSRQFAEFPVRSRRLDFRLPNNEFQAPVYIFASS